MATVWFYNDISGEVKSLPDNAPIGSNTWIEYQGYEASIHTGTDWHKYFSQSSMTSDAARHHWPAPTTSLAGGLGNAAGTAAGTAGGWALHVTGGNGLIGRSLKMIFGGVLIIAGVMRFTGADKDLIQVAAKGLVK